MRTLLSARHEDRVPPQSGGHAMIDLLVVAGVVAFFSLCALYAKACGKLH
ncbi:MAG: hypothetical protein JNN01_01655 [Opitutaceae bacterium]|nr:hypothetical protein [Opitutaceae bacterium]